MKNRILRLPEVMAITGLKRSTLYHFISQGSFPKPIKLGKRVCAWPEEDIDLWISQKRQLVNENPIPDYKEKTKTPKHKNNTENQAELRDSFAMAALMVAYKISVRENDYFEEIPSKRGRATAHDIAERAYNIADIMLEVREK